MREMCTTEAQAVKGVAVVFLRRFYTRHTEAHRKASYNVLLLCRVFIPPRCKTSCEAVKRATR